MSDITAHPVLPMRLYHDGTKVKRNLGADFSLTVHKSNALMKLPYPCVPS